MDEDGRGRTELAPTREILDTPLLRLPLKNEHFQSFYCDDSCDGRRRKLLASINNAAGYYLQKAESEYTVHYSEQRRRVRWHVSVDAPTRRARSL